MEARHRAEELYARDTLGCGKDRRQSVDETDGDIVAIDIVALDRRLFVRTGDNGRRFALRVEQGRRKGGGERQARLRDLERDVQRRAWTFPDIGSSRDGPG